MEFVLAKAKIDSVIGEEDLRAIETCGRISHLSGESRCPESADKFARMIIKLGHESVLEHVNVRVFVQCDRAMAQQWLRHRLASYTMESQRYVRYNELKFVDPEFRDPVDPKKHLRYVDCENRGEIRPLYSNLSALCYNAQQVYKNYLENGVPPEDARTVLPNCTQTTFYTTANIRSWRHFFKERCGPGAQHNIRRVAKELLQEFVEKIPACFVDLAQKFLEEE